MAFASPVQAGPRAALSLTASGGHDNQILAEPNRGVVQAVSDAYGQLTLDFSATWFHILGGDRVGLEVQAQGTEYASGVLGLDGNFLLEGSWSRSVGARGRVRLDGLGWAFRREGMEDFNLNAWRGSGRYTWSLSSSLLLGGGARYQQVGFTDRFVTPDTTLTSGPGDVIVFPVGTDTETDHQTDALLSLLWHRGSMYLWGEGSYRWARSNEPLVEYEGPQGFLRLGFRFSRGDLALNVRTARRRFSEPYVLEEEPRLRRDTAYQLGLIGDRALSPDVRVFLESSWLSQESDIEQFTFEQVQVQAGIKVSLMRPPSELRDLLEMGARAARDGPLVFRYRNAGAGEVFLVGDFNGWNPRANPLEQVDPGVWETAVDLDPGVWRYAYVVDGKWVTPPEARRTEEDGFGGRNGVLIVQ